MKNIMITGAAGFIGANFLKYVLKLHNDIKVVVLDSLTYAGNLGTIKEDIKDSRVVFIKGDIRDNDLVKKIFDDYHIDYVVNFAAESHVDRSIEDPQLFLETNIFIADDLALNGKFTNLFAVVKSSKIITGRLFSNTPSVSFVYPKIKVFPAVKTGIV